MISAIEFEKCVAGAGIFSIVVSKLCHEKKPCFIILLEVDEGSEVGFYYIILSLNLAVRLRVESDRESSLDVEEIA